MQVAYGDEYLAWYKLEKGDTIYDVLHHCGLPLEKIWDYPNNKELREKRKSPFWVTAGDEIRVPQKEIKVETEETENLYRYKTTDKRIPVIDVYLGFMDEEVNARLERLIDSQKNAGDAARPVILIERGKIMPNEPILEWRLGNYKVKPKTIRHVSPKQMPEGTNAPEDILARAMGVMMEYDLASDLDWLARGLKVKRYFDLMKLLQHRGHPKTKSKLPVDATGEGPWMSVVRFDIGVNENAPIIVIRTPEMGLQPSLMCPYLAFLFKAISAMSSQLAHEKGHKWEWPLRVSQFGAQGSSSDLPAYQPGGLVNVIASLFIGVEIARDVTVSAKDQGGGTLKATFKHSEDSTDAAPHRKAKDVDFDMSKKPKQYKDLKQESALRAYSVISLCTPAGVYDFLREEISGPEDVKKLMSEYKIVTHLSHAVVKPLKQFVFPDHIKPKTTNEQSAKAFEQWELRHAELADLEKYKTNLPENKKLEAAQLIAGSIFRWSTDMIKVQDIKLAEGSPFSDLEKDINNGMTLSDVSKKVKDAYQLKYPGGNFSLTGSYFIGEDDKEVADKLGILGVNMEDYHVLRVLHSAIAKGVSKDSDYPIIMNWRIDRINCDPKSLDALVLDKFNEYIKKPQLTLENYVEVILWGLGGVLKEQVPKCAHWGLVDEITKITSADDQELGTKLLKKHLWSFVPETEQAEEGFIVPDPFCIEIATDFVNELAEIKATEEERKKKDGKLGPAGGIADIENKVSVDELTELRRLAIAVKNASDGEVGTKAKQLMIFLKEKCQFVAGENKLKTWLRPGEKWKGVTAPTLQDLKEGEKFGGAAVDRAFYKSCNMMALQAMAHMYFFGT